MAEDYLGGKKLSHTANQVDTVLDESGYVANLAALAALTPPTHLVVVVGEVGVYVWVAGSTATADGVDVVASTVTGYVSAGRWIRKQAGAALITATSEFASIDPSVDSLVLLASERGGIFYWSSGDTAATDGFSIFKTSVSPYQSGGASEGAWRLSGPSIVHFSSWNPDTTGATDESANFRSAVAKAISVGGTLYVGAGTYLFNDIQTHAAFYDHIFSVASNTSIEFAPNAVIRGDKSIGSDGAGYAVFRIEDGIENVTIKGGTFDGIDSTTVKGMGSVVTIDREAGDAESKNLRFLNITAHDLRYQPISAISVSSQTLPIATNVTVQGCYFYDCHGHGIALRAINDVTVANNHIQDCVDSTYTTLGIDISGGHRRGIVVGNTIEGCGGGIKVESTPADGLQSYQAVVTGNAISDTTQAYGIRVSSDYSVISGNTIRNVQAMAIDVNASNNQRGIISDNVIAGVTDNTAGSSPYTDNGRPLSIINRYDGTTVERDRFIVANNVFEDCDAAMTLRSSGVLIQGNHFRDFATGAQAIRVSNDITPDTLYDRIHIDANHFYGFDNSTLYFPDSAAGTDGSDDVSITNNHFYGTGFACLNAENVTGLVITGNTAHVTGSGSHAMYLVDCADVTITGNQLKALGSGTGRPIHLNGCTNVAVAANATESNDENIYINGCDYISVGGNVTNGGTYGVRTLSTTTQGVAFFNQDNGSSSGNSYDANVSTPAAGDVTAAASITTGKLVVGDDGAKGIEEITPASALTAADGSTVDGTYGAEEAAVIANNVTRIGEIEAALQAIGILS